MANGGYLGRSHLQRHTSAVTGACLATRRDVFARLKGFDDRDFKLTYNDIDYCCRINAAGLHVVYTPFATLHHFESVSRGLSFASRLTNDELVAFRAKWSSAMQSDPFHNDHFSRVGRPFTYLSATRRH